MRLSAAGKPRALAATRQRARGDLLVLAAAGIAIAIASGCSDEAGERPARLARNHPRASVEAAGEGRLTARPRARAHATARPGLHQLAPERGALLYLPRGYRPSRPHALVLALHGAGGGARNGLAPLLPLADEAGLILLAPRSRATTWDVLLGGYGPDVAFIDRILAETFARCAVDPRRIAIEGFSDGASYALSLGLTNGDLFDAIIAFSPGFRAPRERRGRPRVFISHGTQDRVLPIDRTSRRIVPELRREGYAVRYREFAGPHTVPPAVAREATRWLSRGRAGR